MPPPDPFADLEPRAVWDHFAALTRIARPSGLETAAVESVRNWAVSHTGFEFETDRGGNAIVRVPATPGREGAPAVILQAHLDMVCLPEATTPAGNNPREGKIHVVRNGDWVESFDTTLGADNGVGVAVILAVVADPDVPHGPLELLFTVGEEVGSVGASAVEPAALRGRVLLNLDTEVFGEITVGSAEGRDTLLRLTRQTSPPPEGWGALGVGLSGLRGGHSGMEISAGRLNAIRGLARLLWAVREMSALRLTALEGGERGNAIPSWARARVILPSEDESEVRAAIARQTEVLREQFPGEGKLAVDVTGPEAAASALSAEDTRSVLALLLGLPNGAVAMSQQFPELVETSNNVAVVKTTNALPGQAAGGKAFTVECSSRSALGGGLRDVTASIAAVAGLAGAEVEVGTTYVGWTADPTSRAVAVLKQAFVEVNPGHEPRVVTTHGGLECGVLANRIPDLDAVSFGPTIERAHSAGERVHTPSVAACYRVLARTLELLSS